MRLDATEPRSMSGHAAGDEGVSTWVLPSKRVEGRSAPYPALQRDLVHGVPWSGSVTPRHGIDAAPTYRDAGPDDADAVQELYEATPSYLHALGLRAPSVQEVRTELATAATDTRRTTQLVLLPGRPPGSGARSVGPDGAVLVGFVDLTVGYIEPTDVTVNLLLVREDAQGLGIGSAVVRDVEARVPPTCDRLLASIFGRNPRARRFWSSHGYTFAIDAAPILEWYAKRVAPSARLAAVRPRDDDRV